MKKAPKIIITIAIVLVVLIVGLFVLAKVLITPERVRDTVVPLAEQALQRKVSLGEIKVSLFSGIELHDLTVSEKQGGEVFVSTDMVRLRYQLLPLLAMRVVIDEVRVDTPHIRVERFSDGSFNFSDLLGADGQAPAAQPAGSGTGGSASTPLDLLVTDVRITNGQLIFLDHLLKGRAPYRHEVTDFQLNASGITLDGSVPLNLSGRLNGAALEMKGLVRLEPLSMEMDVKLSDLDVVQFKNYFDEALPGTLNGLRLGLEARLEGNTRAMSAVGRLTAADLNLTLNAMPDAPLEKAQIGIDYKLAVDLDKSLLSIDRLQLDVNGIVVEATGQIDGLTGTPRADLKLNVPSLDLRKAMQALPAGLVGSQIAELDPAGSLAANAVLVGTIDQPQQLVREASLSLNKIQASVGGQRPSLSGSLLLNGDKLRSENLSLQLGENTADLQLAASSLTKMPVVVRADLTSKRFLLDPLLQGGAATAGAAGGSDSGSDPSVPAVSELGPFDIPVRAEGEIRINETVYKGLAIKDFVASYTLIDNVLTVTRMQGNVAEGSFHNKARLDLGKKGLAYNADLDLKAIQANPLLSAFAPAAAGTLFGQLDMALAIEGTGTEWQVVSKKLTGNGDMAVSNGRLVSPGLVGGLARTLNLSELQNLVFDTFNGNLRIKNGRVQFDGKLNSAQLKLTPQGSIGLDGSLDLGLDTRLSPELAARLDKGGGVIRYLKDDQGWTRVPLKLGGSFSKPSFGLDAKGVQQEAVKSLQQEIGKKLGEKLLGTPKSDQKDGTQQQEDPASKLLKGLFGK